MAVECDEWCSCSNVSITNIIGFGRLLCVCVKEERRKKTHSNEWRCVCVIVVDIRYLGGSLYCANDSYNVTVLYTDIIYKRGDYDGCRYSNFWTAMTVVHFLFSSFSIFQMHRHFGRRKKRVELVTGTVATNTDRNEAYIPKKKKKNPKWVRYIHRTASENGQNGLSAKTNHGNISHWTCRNEQKLIELSLMQLYASRVGC